MATISERLRHLKSLDEPKNGGPYQGFAAAKCMEAMDEAADTIDALVAALDPDFLDHCALEMEDVGEDITAIALRSMAKRQRLALTTPKETSNV